MRMKPQDAEIGMYIKRFDGNWLNHPFWRGHFLIRSDADLQKIRCCDTDFFIDLSKSSSPGLTRRSPIRRATVVQTSELPGGLRSTATVRQPHVFKRLQRSITPQPTFGKADKTRATALARRSSEVVQALFNESRVGRPVSKIEILKVVREISNALEINSFAMISVTRLKARDEYTYTHSVAVCALMINLAREAGMSCEEIEHFAMGGLLHDIGKVRLDRDILQKEGPLTPTELLEVMRHPELGRDILLRDQGVPALVVDVCLHHHERLDGSGYPFGLSADSISHAARMAAICDVYDAATSDRPYKKGRTPIEAISEMHERPDHFDQDILFKFMRSIGVFPVGMLLRLRSNRLGIALKCTRDDTKPIVRAFYSTVDMSFIDCVDVVISDNLASDQVISGEDPNTWFPENWQELVNSILGKPGLGR